MFVQIVAIALIKPLQLNRWNDLRIFGTRMLNVLSLPVSGLLSRDSFLQVIACLKTPLFSPIKTWRLCQ